MGAPSRRPLLDSKSNRSSFLTPCHLLKSLTHFTLLLLQNMTFSYNIFSWGIDCLSLGPWLVSCLPLFFKLSVTPSSLRSPQVFLLASTLELCPFLPVGDWLQASHPAAVVEGSPLLPHTESSVSRLTHFLSWAYGAHSKTISSETRA